MDDVSHALRVLRNHRHLLTKQQTLTLRGQVLAGDIAGAMRGLEKIKAFKEAQNGH